MVSNIKITGNASVSSIDIEGIIGVPEQVQFGSPDDRVATYARFASSLAALRELKAKEVVVNIRSTGGDVNDALLIYDALRELDARVTTRCFGYVASAATIIAQAASGGGREISSNALYLIHCSESAAEGNSQALCAAKELLDRTDERIAAIYGERSGRPARNYRSLMGENGGKGRWLAAQEAVEAGLADRIIGPVVTNDAGEGLQAGEEILALCRLFGLTPPPDSSRTCPKRKKEIGGNTWGSLRKVLQRLLRGGWMQEEDNRMVPGPDSSGGVKATVGCGTDPGFGAVSEGVSYPAQAPAPEETAALAGEAASKVRMEEESGVLPAPEAPVGKGEPQAVQVPVDSAGSGPEAEEGEEREATFPICPTVVERSEESETEPPGIDTLFDRNPAEPLAGASAGGAVTAEESSVGGAETGSVTVGVNPAGFTGAFSGDRYAGEAEAVSSPESTNAALPRDAASVSPPIKDAITAFRNAQSAACPTEVKAVEDPSIEERSPSPNEQAYYQDALSMRSRL